MSFAAAVTPSRKSARARPVLGVLPAARLALATRRGETDPIIRNLLARALARAAA